MPIDQSGKNLLEKAASGLAAAAKRSPLFLPKRDGQNSRCALPGALYPPQCQKRQIPLLPISCRTHTSCYRGGAQDLSSETAFLPKSTLLISNRVGGDGPEFLEHCGTYDLPEFTTKNIKHYYNNYHRKTTITNILRTPVLSTGPATFTD